MQMMKRLLLLVLVALSLWSAAGAEMDREAQQAFAQAWPGYRILASDAWGDSAAAILARDTERLLCVAERYNGRWQVIISNATALRPGVSYTVLMDTDTSLFWYCREDGMQYSYASTRENGVWGPVSCMRTVEDVSGLTETEHVWHQGWLHRNVWRRDKNENLEYRQTYPPVPVAWLGEKALLENYDHTVFPEPGAYMDSWLSREILAACAGELRPGWTFLGGSAEEALMLLLRDPQGEIRLLGVTYDQGKAVEVESSPLPEGTVYGCENFTTVITLPSGLMAQVGPNGDGTWRVYYTWPNTAEGEPVFMGVNWVAQDTLNGTQRMIGDHPWSDIAAMDWTTLPHTLKEASRRMDAQRWAVVSNPDPADRLHLRTRADKNAPSLGKYYNGTPAEVLDKGETWTRVRVGSAEGWMMTRYLTMSDGGIAVKDAFPQLETVHGKENMAYEAADRQAAGWLVSAREKVCIIGVVGEDWYHVWFPESNRYGFMEQLAFTPGNG